MLKFCCFGIMAGGAFAGEFLPLFNGTDLKGWEKIIAGQEVGEDPAGLITVREGKIHMYEKLPEEAEDAPFGVIMTEKSYGKFHLRFEYQWGEKKFAPRKEKLRDAGLLYHCFGPKTIWPASIECQVQEGDTGDLVLITSRAMSWGHPRPAEARPGKGFPGRLPEHGGVLKALPVWTYLGRFPETDYQTGWNVVEAIVHEDSYAVHKVNGAVTSRLLDMRKPDGSLLKEGPLALQLEAAEVLYRNVEICELDGYLRPNHYQLSLSRVKGLPGQVRTVVLENTGTEPLKVNPVFLGQNVGAFEVEDADFSPLKGGEKRRFAISFHPDLGAGDYVAGIQFGEEATGAFIQLNGVATAALEGRNEPSLHRVVRALGASVNVGGEALELDSSTDVLGESMSGWFAPVKGEEVRVTPVARYSPAGVTPFGLYLADGEKRELGRLRDSGAAQPDAHQALLREPGISLNDVPERFGLYLEGPRFISYTCKNKSEGTAMPWTARVWPVGAMGGRRLDNAFLIGFEEAMNGDYQDVVLLLEGVKLQEPEKKD